MRIFLIILSFINTLLYVLIYAYYDTILGLLGTSLLSAGMQNFLKAAVLIAAGFCIGLMPMLLLSPGIMRSRFDVKNLLLVGTVPFILLVLSPGPVTDMIASRIFGNNESIREMLFYLLSRQVLWSVWLGFAAGTSVRIHFGRRRQKHTASYISGEKEMPKTGQDENQESREAF
ncbi:MAG: hypothetical protein K8S14_01400 [Actinomycetia bacterium]|nr:hypothetical protein [Actinomycetes bacterium]